MLRSQNTQNAQTLLKNRVGTLRMQLISIRQCTFDPFQMDQPKTLPNST